MKKGGLLVKKKIISLLILACFLVTGCEQNQSKTTDTTGTPTTQTSNETAGIATKDLKEQYQGSEPYEVQKEPIVLAANEKLEMKAPGADTRDYENFKGVDIAIPLMLFKDAELTQTIASTYLEERTSEGFVLDPTVNSGTTVFNTSGEKETLAQLGTWGSYDRLYLMQYNDLDTGALLEIPKLYLVTIEQETSLPVPNVQMTITDDGQLQLAWQPVEGATSYKIVRENDRLYNEKLAFLDNTYFEQIGEVEKTQWFSGQGNALDFGTYDNMFSQDALANPANENNLQFKEAYEKTFPREMYDLFVIAIDKEGHTSAPSNQISAEDFIAKIPTEFAQYTYQKQSGGQQLYEEFQGFDQLPDQLPLIMADGSVRQYAVTYQTEDLEQIGTSANRYLSVVSYTLNKTIFSGQLNVIDEKADYQVALTAKNESIANKAKSGGLEVPVTIENVSAIKIDKDNYSDTLPEVPVKVNADTALAEYLSANLFAQKEFIGLADFPEAQDTELLRKTLETIKFQNPLLPENFTYYYSEKEQLLQVDYPDDDSAKELQEVQTEVVRVAKEILSDGMSDVDKIKAINQYLIDHADYDYEALDQRDAYDVLRSAETNDPNAASVAYADLMRDYGYAWKAQGVLLDQKGVCSSYAKAFLLLASQAGLESVYVTGDTPNGLHAWNYVKVDGTWRVVDVTWNDTSGENEKWLNLSLDDPTYTDEHYPDEAYLEYATAE